MHVLVRCSNETIQSKFCVTRLSNLFISLVFEEVVVGCEATVVAATGAFSLAIPVVLGALFGELLLEEFTSLPPDVAEIVFGVRRVLISGLLFKFEDGDVLLNPDIFA